MSVYRDIYKKISASQREAGLNGTSGRVVRLLKLNEEVGEVVQAYIGLVGANKRKGHTHTEADIAKELCDVVITATVALHDWTHDPTGLLITQIAALRERIDREGS